MPPYSHPSIHLNGRNIEMIDILNGHATPTSEFELSTCRFIKNWLEGADEFLQQTSGSTGKPKQITITRQQMVASAKMTEEFLKLTPSDVALVCLDPEYIAGKMMLVRSFVTGMRIVAIAPSSNPFRQLSPDIKIDFVALVPMQLNALVNSENVIQLKGVKKIIVGGAPISLDLQKRLSVFPCEMYATYGMTETISHIALQRLTGSFQSDYFVALPGVRISTDSRGCLVVHVPFLKEHIVTNDLVEIQDTTHFKWLGRSDNIINSGGVKIIPEKIEASIAKALQDLGEPRPVLITSIPDDRLGNKVICLMEGELTSLLMKKIKEILPRVLPPYEIPKDLFSMPIFVYTDNGKLDRRRTTEKFLRQ